MRSFFIFLAIFFYAQMAISEPEINPRGVPMSFKIQRRNIKGYAISEASIKETRKSLQDFLQNFELNDNQIGFLIDFYINTGFAESCYVMESSVFSVEKEVGGKAVGFIQIMPSTATQVIDEVFESRDSFYINYIENLCKKSLDMTLRELKSQIRSDTTNRLNCHNISMFIFYLKFSNREFKDIPGFNFGEPKNTIQTQAQIWKKVWNTYLGKGTEKLFVKRVKECNEII